jgi:hypothetical protein
MMKACSFLMAGILLVAASMVVITGCEYDGPTAQYYQEHSQTPVLRVTGINPSEAGGGVNYITILGENFSAELGKNKVYFDGTEAEITSGSTTSLKVRRPNKAGDSTTVKVVSYDALVTGKYGPYKIKLVSSAYGNYVSGLELTAVAADNAENLYIVERISGEITKITPDGQKTIMARVTRAPSDARVGPGGRLYLIGATLGHRDINAMNLATGETKLWHRLGSTKPVKFGDFDVNGYFYAGGTRTDLMVISPDSTNRAAGLYATSEILAMRVYNGYVYVAARVPGAQNPASIGRHQILDAMGNLGSRELVLDLATGEFASRSVKGLTFSQDGIMYIATDSPAPILIFNPATNDLDYLYKGILPSYCKDFYWGAGNYLYMLRGDTALQEEWNIYRIDMGTAGAPNYGS